MGSDALERLMAHDWPGNVRELANLMQKMLIFNQGGAVTAGDVRRAIGTRHPERDAPRAAPGPVRGESPVISHVRQMLENNPGDKIFDAPMDEMRVIIIREALALCGGNRSRTARMLGLSRPTLLAKINKYGL